MRNLILWCKVELRRLVYLFIIVSGLLLKEYEIKYVGTNPSG